MQVSRVTRLVDPRRLARCRRHFSSPWQAHSGLSFVGGSTVAVTHRETARTLRFSRRGGDHRLWDWLLARDVPFRFVAEGAVQIDWDGRKINLRPGTKDFYIFREVFLRDDYDLFGPGRRSARFGTVIDIGANVGMFTLAVLPRAGRVVSVEACAANYAALAGNIAANGGDGRNALHMAVAGESGRTLRLNHDPRNTGGHSLVRSNETGDGEAVTTISLADLWVRAGRGPVDLLKCDIEGGEYDALLPAPDDVLRACRRIVMELHVGPSLPPRLASELVAKLDRLGFRTTLDAPLPTTDATAVRVLRAEMAGRTG